jgi:hypothetical protein
MFTTDGWGGYTIWRYDGAQPVFMDDRYDMYPRAVNDAYDTIAQVAPGWEKALDRYGVDVVVWPRERSLAQVLAASPQWHRVYRDDLAVVFVRN